jgi:hypothetical protein
MKRRFLIAGTLCGVILGLWLIYRYTHPEPAWILSVIEPAQGGGFTSGYDSEADCNKAVQRWRAEAAWFKAAGQEKDAPRARCYKTPMHLLPNGAF